MASKAVPSAASSSSSCDPIDIPELFNSVPSSSSVSSVSQQSVTLSSVSFNADLSKNSSGESEIGFNVAAVANQRLNPDSWKFSGSADVGVDTYCCCFSADSKYFITGGGDCNIRLWNPATKSLVATLVTDTNIACSLTSFILDGKSMLVSGSFDCTIRVWELKDNISSSLCVATMQTGNYPCALVFCSTQNALISGQPDGTIKLWSTSDWQLVRSLPSSNQVTALSLSPDESKLASGHADGSIQIWDMAAYASINSWKAATEYITYNGLCFCPSQPNLVVAAAFDGSCSTWNCSTGSKICCNASQVGSSYSPASFSLDGMYMVSVSGSNQLIFLDASATTVITTLEGSPSVTENISSACFSPDGKYLACTTSSGSKSLYIWESPLASIAGNRRFIVPHSTDFRIVRLSELTCLVVVLLESGGWAAAIVESAPADLSITEWAIIVPRSIRHPIAKILSPDGIVPVLDVYTEKYVELGPKPVNSDSRLYSE